HRARAVVAQYAQDFWFFAPGGGVPQLPGKLNLTTAMVEGAALEPSGWTLQGELSIEHPPSGTWQIGDGFYIISPRVAPDLALGFRGLYTARWQQTVTEDYTLNVVWQGLEEQVGIVSEEIGATLESR